jgi:uncharacterized Zn finger protein (UPF0148 family)
VKGNKKLMEDSKKLMREAFVDLRHAVYSHCYKCQTFEFIKAEDWYCRNCEKTKLTKFYDENTVIAVLKRLELW